MRVLRWLALSLLLGAGLAQAETLHVRPDGDDGCNGRANAPGSARPSACAFRTPQKGVDALRAGDTLLLHAGTYTDCRATGDGNSTATIHFNQDFSGTPGNPMVIKAAGDGPVTLSGGGSCHHAIYMDGPFGGGDGWVHFGGPDPQDGFTIAGDYPYQGADSCFAGHGVITVCDGMEALEFRNLTIEANTSVSGDPEGGVVSITGDSASNLVLEDNHITAKNDRRIIRINCSECSGSSCDCEDAIIRGNTLIQLADGGGAFESGLYVKGIFNALITENHIRVGEPEDAATGGEGALYIRDDINARVHNNYIEAYLRSNSIGAVYILDTTSHTENHDIYNLTVYGSGPRAFQLQDCDSCRVRNNLVKGAYSGAWNAGMRCEKLSGGATGSTMGFNHFHDVNNSYEGPGGSGSCSSACTDLPFTCDGNDRTDDPRLQESGAFPVPFLQLTSSSPGIDGGVATSAAPSVDFEGEARVGNPDIGADEFGGGPGSVAAPGGIRRGEGESGS